MDDCNEIRSPDQWRLINNQYYSDHSNLNQQLPNSLTVKDNQTNDSQSINEPIIREKLERTIICDRCYLR